MTHTNTPIWGTLLFILFFVLATIGLLWLSNRRYKQKRKMGSFMYGVMAIITALFAFAHVVQLIIQ